MGAAPTQTTKRAARTSGTKVILVIVAVASLAGLLYWRSPGFLFGPPPVALPKSSEALPVAAWPAPSEDDNGFPLLVRAAEGRPPLAAKADAALAHADELAWEHWPTADLEAVFAAQNPSVLMQRFDEISSFAFFLDTCADRTCARPETRHVFRELIFIALVQAHRSSTEGADRLGNVIRLLDSYMHSARCVESLSIAANALQTAAKAAQHVARGGQATDALRAALDNVTVRGADGGRVLRALSGELLAQLSAHQRKLEDAQDRAALRDADLGAIFQRYERETLPRIRNLELPSPEAGAEGLALPPPPKPWRGSSAHAPPGLEAIEAATLVPVEAELRAAASALTRARNALKSFAK